MKSYSVPHLWWLFFIGVLNQSAQVRNIDLLKWKSGLDVNEIYTVLKSHNKLSYSAYDETQATRPEGFEYLELEKVKWRAEEVEQEGILSDYSDEFD